MCTPARLGLLLLTLLALPACSTAPTPALPPSPTVPSPTQSPATLTPSPTIPITPSPSPFPETSRSTLQAPRSTDLCSPLPGVAVADLPALISNPFHPPKLGSDDPHQGVDFSDLFPGTQIAREGAPVQAVLAGKVAMVTDNRFPYGNAIWIETPLEDLPDGWLTNLALPTPMPTLVPGGALTCPTLQPLRLPTDGSRSLYLLYAHMQAPPTLPVDEAVTCGQPLGSIGATGNILAPHLHLEVRVGPSGMRLGSLAHYDASATLEEMSNYCTWRTSGLFQWIDPMLLLGLAP